MLQLRTIRYFSACCLFFLAVIAVFFGSNSQGIIFDIPSGSQRFYSKEVILYALVLTERVSTLTAFSIPRSTGRMKGIMRTSGEIDFRFRLKLKITLVESTYPSQRPQCPSLSPHFLLNIANLRFASLEGSIETFIEEQENQNTVKKTKRDVAFITEFLQTKGETQIEIAEILPAELNEPLSEFILSVRHRFEVC